MEPFDETRRRLLSTVPVVLFKTADHATQGQFFCRRAAATPPWHHIDSLIDSVAVALPEKADQCRVAAWLGELAQASHRRPRKEARAVYSFLPPRCHRRLDFETAFEQCASLLKDRQAAKLVFDQFGVDQVTQDLLLLTESSKAVEIPSDI